MRKAFIRSPSKLVNINYETSRKESFVRSTKSSIVSHTDPAVGAQEDLSVDELLLFDKKDEEKIDLKDLVQKVSVLSKSVTPAGISVGDVLRYSLQPYFVGVDSKDLERELDQLIPLLETGVIQDEEFQIRKRNLLSLLPKDSPVYQLYALDDEITESESTQPSVIIDGIAIDQKGRVNSKVEKKREIRLFISSTFRDMQDERDELMKHVFPRIRQICANRGIFFSEIDLRWGITAEQSQSGEVIDICLSEIDRCTHFINILGERYGWMPSQYKPEIVKKFPFLSKLTPGETSVTEMEVLYALSGGLRSKSHFFFRDQKTTSLEDGDQPEKMKKLKSQISQTGLPLLSYTNVSDMASRVLKFLTDEIDKEFPANSNGGNDSSSREELAHDTFASSRAKLYVSNPSLLQNLSNYINDSETRPLLVLGSTGSGKSSFLSNWFIQSKSRLQTDQLVIPTFIGSSTSSTDYLSVLRRILILIKSSLRINDDIPDDPKQLAREFPRWLKKSIPQEKKLILLLDAVDQLRDIGDGGLNFSWLPDTLPANVKLILSTSTTHASSGILKKRGYKHLYITSLNRKEKQLLATEYLKMFGKSLSPNQLKSITEVRQTSNPLYMRALLDELRVHGVFEELDSRVSFYLRARDSSELFHRMLMRLEADYDSQYPGIVCDVFSVIWVSKDGLSESEIIDILELPRMVFAGFSNAIKDLFVTRAGLLNFYHDDLRKAVERKYLPNKELKRKYHLKIADYFEDNATPIERESQELPWALLNTESWFRLRKCLSNLGVFLYLFNKQTKYDLKSYWIKLQSDNDVVQAYLESLEKYEKTVRPSSKDLSNVTFRVAKFLKEMLQYDGALSLLDRMLSVSVDTHEIASTNYLIAQIYWNQGKWDKAEPHCTKAMEIWERIHGESSTKVAKCLCGLGEMLIERDPKKAKPLLERSMQIYTDNYGREHHRVSRILHDLATINDSFGLHEEAVKLHFEAIKIRERVLGSDHAQLGVSFEVLGITYKLLGKLKDAEKSFRKALEINEKVHGEMYTGVASCCEWLVMVNNELGKPFDADRFEDKRRKVQEHLDALGITVGERIVD